MSKVTARAVLVCAMFALSFLDVRAALGQCLPHPELRTAVLFANETSFELTFFIDADETGIAVQPKAVSPEQPVVPGKHIFRARAMVDSRAIWVWVINEVPTGSVCTWTVTDPAHSSRMNSNSKQEEQRNVREQ